MSRTSEDQCRTNLKRACTNVIGFGKLLKEPTARKFSHVKKLQYRAYLLGTALCLADMILEQEDAMAGLFPDALLPELRDLAEDFKIMVQALDGDCPEMLDEQAVEFGWQVRAALGR